MRQELLDHPWALPLESLAGLAVLLPLLFAAFLAKRWWLLRRPGAFECYCRIPGGGWQVGVARYQADDLAWYAMFSLSVQPRYSWPRRDLELNGTHPARSAALLPGFVVAQVTSSGAALDLAMNEDTLTGFSSWLESAPPGFRGVH